MHLFVELCTAHQVAGQAAQAYPGNCPHIPDRSEIHGGHQVESFDLFPGRLRCKMQFIRDTDFIFRYPLKKLVECWRDIVRTVG